MAETIEQLAQKFAEKLNKPVNELVVELTARLQKAQAEEQGEDVDVNPVDPSTPLTSKQHQQLLSAFGKASTPGRITLRRRRVGEVKTKSSGDAGSSVKVEYRKSKTYIQRAALKPEQEEALIDQKLEEEKQHALEEQAEKQAVVEEKAAAPEAPAEPVAQPAAATEEKPKPKKKAKEHDKKPKVDRDKSKRDVKSKRSEPRTHRMMSLGGDDDDGGRRRRRRKSKERENAHAFAKPSAPIIREVNVPETITVGDLAQRMAVKSGAVIKAMMGMGVMATINQVIDQDTAILVVEEMGHKATPINENALEEALTATFEGDLLGEKVQRAPVVTIMGHVDHGKTSLLDYIRRTRVTAGEAGGITQHIGAYRVSTDKGEITFLDTPGHAAFSSMRARGALCTDVVVLVVAADDGVMPQTIEAIQHAKAANVPVIVAVNKIDKEGADPDRIKTELANHELIPEEWGGETIFAHVSAKSGEGVDALLDSILVQSEVLELNAVSDGPARGVVIESRLDKGRGPVATLLIQQGTLHKGDVVLVGLQYGRVRAMLDENGKPKDAAPPSTPVEILGLSGTPNSGDDMHVVTEERKAREIALFRQAKSREVKFAKQHKQKLEGMLNQMGKDEVSLINIVLKADVQGSTEALSDALTKLSNDEVAVKIVGSGVGGINESDVTLAMASNALLMGFNVRADASARKLSAQEGVSINYYSVIYDIIDHIKAAMTGMLNPVFKEEILGLAEVRDVFRSSKLGAVAGCMVIEGTLKRNNPIRVLRDNIVIYEGELESLRRFKEDVNEVRNGMECGIGVKNYNDIKAGDQIEVFHKIEVKRSL